MRAHTTYHLVLPIMSIHDCKWKSGQDMYSACALPPSFYLNGYSALRSSKESILHAHCLGIGSCGQLITCHVGRRYLNLHMQDFTMSGHMLAKIW
jgi:hypothetical protein